jgi:hypothetical protein
MAAPLLASSATTRATSSARRAWSATSRAAMTLTEHDISVLLLGAAIGSAITYWGVTRATRLYSSVRNQIERYGENEFYDYPRWEEKLGPDPVTDQEIRWFYEWAQRVRLSKEPSSYNRKKLDPIKLTALGIICDKLLERDDRHSAAIQALLDPTCLDALCEKLLSQSKDQKGNNDIAPSRSV